MQINPSHAFAQTPCVYYICKKVQISMAERVLIQGFKLSPSLSPSLSLSRFLFLSLSLSVSLTSDAKSVVRTYQL